MAHLRNSFDAFALPGRPAHLDRQADVPNTPRFMAEPKTNELMDKIVSLCKRRGFVFQSSEIYGGINGFWDYGPLGAELKRNVKDLWWRWMVRERDDVAGLDATIIMHPQIWKASGHVETFSDPMCDCLLTNKRFRADQVEPQSGVVYSYEGALGEEVPPETIGHKALLNYLAKHDRNQSLNVPQLVSEISAFFGTESTPHQGETVDELVGHIAQSVLRVWRDQRFSVLLPAGKPPKSVQDMAKEFYTDRGLKNPTLLGETTSNVVDSRRFNPELSPSPQLTEPRPFNLMFRTRIGPVDDPNSEEGLAYLRPETAQAIFAQFKNVLETSRQKVPFGIAQVGKAFRNEVTPRNFTFRSREFEQMELEFFIRPDEAVEAICGRVATVAEVFGVPPSGSTGPAAAGTLPEPQANWGWEVWHKYWVEQRIRFYESIGLPRTTLEEYWQKPEELSHYARATVDLLFKFPFGTQELEGIAARSDFDLSQHQRFSGKPMTVFDDELKLAWPKLDPARQTELRDRYAQARLRYLTKTGEPAEKAERQAREEAEALTKGYYVPHVIEPSAGVDRLALALLCHAYTEDQAPDEKGRLESRVVMKFHPRIAPIKVGVFPLLKNRPELVAKARQVRDLLRPHLNVFYDEAGAIGRRYRRQDEAGTPFGVTIDFDTLGEKGPELQDTVTLRDRDTLKQERVKIAELLPLLLEKVR